MPAKNPGLAAKPKDATHLQFGEEVREIDEGVGCAQEQEQAEPTQRSAVHLRNIQCRYSVDIQCAILDKNPQMVRFTVLRQELDADLVTLKRLEVKASKMASATLLHSI